MTEILVETPSEEPPDDLATARALLQRVVNFHAWQDLSVRGLALKTEIETFLDETAP